MASGTANASSTRDSAPPSRIAGPTIVLGFAAAISMWLAWLVAHQPWIDLPAGLSGPAMVLLLAAGAAVAGGCAGRRLGIAVGAATGLVAAALNLLVMGSLVSEQADEAARAAGEAAASLTPSGQTAMLGFLGLGVALGGVAGGIAGLLRANPSPVPLARWTARFAIVAVLSVVPLLLLGGLVTSTDAGLAVPDWPGSYGANMFLYPIALMADPRIFLEHSHRLFGTLVGVTMIAQAVLVWSQRSMRRRWDLRISVAAVLVCGLLLVGGMAMHTRGDLDGLAFGGVALLIGVASVAWFLRGLAAERPAQAAAALLLMVGAQGVLGGTRVTEASPLLGSIHGVLGQVFFASTVLFAAWLSPSAATLRADGAARAWVRGAAWFLLAALVLQLTLGALHRHGSHAEEHLAPWALHGHMGFSVVVVLAAAITGFAMVAQGRGPSASADTPHERTAARACGRIGLLLALIVFGQFVLGWVTFFVVSGAPPRTVPTAGELQAVPPVPVAEAIVTFLHQATGAGLIAIASAAVVWAGLARPAVHARPARAAVQPG
ncbi:MAG: COX15/CtaA family protein [Planctomycetota bacterium]